MVTIEELEKEYNLEDIFNILEANDSSLIFIFKQKGTQVPFFIKLSWINNILKESDNMIKTFDKVYKFVDPMESQVINKVTHLWEIVSYEKDFTQEDINLIKKSLEG